MDSVQAVDNSFEDVEYKLYLKQLRAELEEVMKDKLTLKQREVLQFRYGWYMEPTTLKDVGDILDMYPERVRQIESKALREMRKTLWCRTRGKEYYNEIFGEIKLSYGSVEKGIDFMNRYFKNVI